MKYDADIDLSDNASHAVVADLIGSGKRVLDVGCSTGYLAAALVQRGNVVSGVEVDAEAAERARPVLDKLVVGDLESVDLGEAFEPASFDVVIFADVLEHLTDPGRVLAQSAGLLAEGGYVVASIPNVAHGSVRLALLQGRFEYRDLGLLDSTHLRFFTRDSVQDLFYEAGFAPMEIRRTERQFFDTEIPLDETDFPAEVVRRVGEDYDAFTFQFVVRAVPVSEQAGTAALLGRLREQQAELVDLDARLQRVVRAAIPSSLPLTVGAVGRLSAGEPLEALGLRIIAEELSARLPGASIRYLDAAGSVDGDESGGARSAGGAVVARGTGGARRVDDGGEGETPGHGGGRRVSLDGSPVGTVPAPGPALDDLRSQLDATVVTAADLLPWERGGTPGRAKLSPAEVGGAAVGEPLTATTEIYALAGRLSDQGSLRMRGEYLRRAGLLPEGPLVVVDAAATSRPGAVELARAISELCTERQAVCVLGALGSLQRDAFAPVLGAEVPDAWIVPAELDATIDRLAVVAAAELVISDAPAALWLAEGLCRPWVGLEMTGTGRLGTLAAVGQVVGRADALAAAAAAAGAAAALAAERAAAGSVPAPTDYNDPSSGAGRSIAGVTGGPSATEELVGAVDRYLDRLAVDIRMHAATRRHHGEVQSAVSDLERRLRRVEAANVALGQQLAAERVRFSGLLAGGGQPAPSAAVGTGKLAKLEAERDEARAELAALYNTRTMRTVEPARRLYARLRNRGS